MIMWKLIKKIYVCFVGFGFFVVGVDFLGFQRERERERDGMRDGCAA